MIRNTRPVEIMDVSEDQNPGRSGPNSTQKRVIWIYKVLFTIQLTAGVGIVGSSSFAFLYEQESGDAVPYYTGGYLIGVVLMFLAAVAFCVWRKGPNFHANEKARREVLCAINVHRVTSILMFIVGIVGLCILLTFGLCTQDSSECSYEKNEIEHRAIVTVSLVFGFVGLVTSSVGIFLIRQLGSAFGIEVIRSRPPVPSVSGTVQMNELSTNNNIPDSETQRELDMQRQRELQLSPFAVVSGTTGGVTNSAFGPPELPPYTPSASLNIQEQTENTSETGNEFKLHSLVSIRPPPYTSSVDIPSSSAPQHPAESSGRDCRCSSKVHSKIKKYMLNQID